MYNPLQILVILPVFLISSLAIAGNDPIRVFGIDVSMTKELIVAELKNRGVGCDENESGDLYCTNLNSEDSGLSSDDAMAFVLGFAGENPYAIRINGFSNGSGPENIKIGCTFLGICEYTLKNAAEMLVDSVNVSSLDYEPDAAVTALLESSVDRFCGVGDAGDKVCISASMMVPNTGDVALYRASYGRQKPSFN
jgi:hypothetical protein